jgi:hypothetical protein
MASSSNQIPAKPAVVKPQASAENSEDDKKSFLSASTELVFVLLPFIVIGIVFAHLDQFRSIFFIPEWSIVSAVIIGQSIVKIASSSVGRANVEKEWIILVMASLLVGLLIPILIVLTIALTSPKISNTLATAQGIFFVVSCVIFWLASAIEHGIKPGA